MAVKTQLLKYKAGVMKPGHFISLSLILSIFVGCVTFHSRHPKFTSINVYDLRVGMTQKEIEDRFGSPDRTTVITVETKTQDPWPALIYYYDMEKNLRGKYTHIGKTNTFYFAMDIQPPLLHSWDLELVYPDRK